MVRDTYQCCCTIIEMTIMIMNDGDNDDKNNSLNIRTSYTVAMNNKVMKTMMILVKIMVNIKDNDDEEDNNNDMNDNG